MTRVILCLIRNRLSRRTTMPTARYWKLLPPVVNLGPVDCGQVQRDRVKGLAISSALLFLLLLSGCHKPQAPAATATAPRKVVIQPTVKALKRICEQPGHVDAYEETPLFAGVPGFVDKVLVDIGDRVKKDQPLARLAVPELADKVRQKKAQLAETEAEIQQYHAAVDEATAAAMTAEAQLAEAQAAQQRTQAEFVRSQSELARVTELAARSAVTQKLVDEARSAFEGTDGARKEVTARIATSRAQLAESQAKIVRARADETAARARRDVANAELSEAQAIESYTVIHAPFDGIVTRRNVHPGHHVEPGLKDPSQALLTVTRTDIVRVVIDVPEIDAAFVDPGDSVLFSLQSGAIHREAAITRISWALHATSRTLRAEVDLPNQSGELRPGMYVYATIVLDQRPKALTLPASAIGKQNNQPFCVVVEGTTARRRAIKTGLRAGKEVEILEGLSETDKVLLSDPASVADGEIVEPIAPPKP